MVSRSPARYLAPLALLATVATTVVIVSEATDTSHHMVLHPRIVGARRLRAGAPGRRLAASYVVRSGDSLSTISARTGVPVASLEALNPTVDPNALQTGQRLRLRR